MAAPVLVETPSTSPSVPLEARLTSTRAILPPRADREPIRTERLLLRPIAASDAEALHVLRTQPEVMQWTMVGKVDENLDQTREWIANFLPPKDEFQYEWVVIYKGSKGEEEEGNDLLIGVGGIKNFNPQPPVLGYMFVKEYWHKGIATEFLRAVLAAWWALPRREVEVGSDAQADLASVKGRRQDMHSNMARVPEYLSAVIAESNKGSNRVLEKCGFKEYKRWKEPESRAGHEGEDALLVGLLLEAPTN
ncbi:acetyltransferase domain-containing protein [Poronia punctata]|nr:acetyltransferase domain-containing protein [Poronia punctata]